MPFWQFFRQGRDGRAVLVRPSRIPHRFSKNIFALGADEFLAMIEGKIRVTPFFKGKKTVWSHIYVPNFWVDLSFNSRVILDFFLFWNCKLQNCRKYFALKNTRDCSWFWSKNDQFQNKQKIENYSWVKPLE